MEVRRTAVVKLRVSDEQRDALHRTAKEYLHCVNRTSEYCWSDTSYEECKTHKRKVRDALYADLREETDYLNANLVQAAIKRGVEAVKSCVDRWKKGRRVSQPVHTAETMDYNVRSATFYRTKASFATVDSPVELPFVLPSDSPTPYEQYVLSEEHEFRESTLRYDAATDDYYFHVSVRRYDSDEENEREDTDDPADTDHRQTVLGIDLGVNSLATSTTGTFWQGDDYDHWIGEFEKRRAKMQQRGTQAAYNALLRLGKRERAWRKQYIHTVANDVVREAVETECDVIVFEDLTDIRDRLPHAEWHHIWAFRRLYEYVEYKGPERGVSVEQVEPNHTSQRCSKCGFTHKKNRSGTDFCCRKCGYRINADYNGAKNVGLRYARQQYHRLRSGQKSLGGDAPVSVRVNRGTMTDDGPRPVAGD